MPENDGTNFVSTSHSETVVSFKILNNCYAHALLKITFTGLEGQPSSRFIKACPQLFSW
jgi:hypothetical protein